MDIPTFLKGLETLNAPNQGMSYHSGGPRRGGPKYDAYTGERVTPRYDPAELNVYSDRAKFLHDLIRGADELLPALRSALNSPPAGGGGDQGASVAQSAGEGLRPFASDSSCQSEGGR